MEELVCKCGRVLTEKDRMSARSLVCSECGELHKPGQDPAAARPAAGSVASLPRVEVRTESFELPVEVSVPLTGGKDAFRGKGTLQVSFEGLRVSVAKILGTREATLSWRALRNLRDELNSHKCRFIAQFHDGTEIFFLTIIPRADVERLCGVFDQLPEHCLNPECPACAGVVLDGTCRSCGESFSRFYTQAGLARMVGGLLLLGCVLPYFFLAAGAMDSLVFKMLFGALFLGGVGLLGSGVRLMFFRERA